MKKTSLAISLLLAFSLSGPAQGANYVLGDFHPASDPTAQVLTGWAKEVGERRKDISISVRAGGDLGREMEMIDKLRRGQLDMARVHLESVASVVPFAQVVTLPYVFRSREHMWSTMRGEIGKQLEGQMAESGLVVIAFLESGARNFYTTKRAIRSRGDFEGLRLHVAQPRVYGDLIRQLGGSAVALTPSAVREALRKGEIDGADGDLVEMVDNEHYRHVKYVNLDSHAIVPDVLIMSAKAWNALKPDQQAYLKTSAEAAAARVAAQWVEQEQRALEVLRKAGVTILSRSQIAMAGIESFAVSSYKRYLSSDSDLATVLKIVSSK